MVQEKLDQVALIGPSHRLGQRCSPTCCRCSAAKKNTSYPKIEDEAAADRWLFAGKLRLLRTRFLLRAAAMRVPTGSLLLLLLAALSSTVDRTTAEVGGLTINTLWRICPPKVVHDFIYWVNVRIDISVTAGFIVKGARGSNLPGDRVHIKSVFVLVVYMNVRWVFVSVTSFILCDVALNSVESASSPASSSSAEEEQRGRGWGSN